MLSRKDELGKENTYMKRLITIILALIMSLFSAQQKGSDEPYVTAEKNTTAGDNNNGGASYPKKTKRPQKRRLKARWRR